MSLGRPFYMEEQLLCCRKLLMSTKKDFSMCGLSMLYVFHGTSAFVAETMLELSALKQYTMLIMFSQPSFSALIGMSSVRQNQPT